VTPDFRGGGQKQKRHNWIQLCLKSVFKTTHASICRGEHKKTYAKVKLNFFMHAVASLICCKSSTGKKDGGLFFDVRVLSG
jgi:hypothetical protein